MISPLDLSIPFSSCILGFLILIVLYFISELIVKHKEDPKNKKFVRRIWIAVISVAFSLVSAYFQTVTLNSITALPINKMEYNQKNTSENQTMSPNDADDMQNRNENNTKSFQNVSTASTAAPRKTVKIGEIIYFGNYKNEKIDWYVVDIDEVADTALLVSVKAVDVVQYHKNKRSTNWADCDLRHWLNDTFFFLAFDQEERENYIQTSTVEGSKDKVYILSKKEAKQYLSAMGGSWLLTKCSNLCKTTDTATGTRIYNYDHSKNSSGGYPWWLRSTTTAEKADLVGASGYDPEKQMPNNPPTSKDNGVRPVILVSMKLFR